mmetsp:Transcript_15378/g.39626  ORF Transcript_15378/g.39626 Transcript_15378/m.39626 type:complete len:213 (-) Transcript_15378:1090-1728(-)
MLDTVHHTVVCGGVIDGSSILFMPARRSRLRCPYAARLSNSARSISPDASMSSNSAKLMRPSLLVSTCRSMSWKLCGILLEMQGLRMMACSCSMSMLASPSPPPNAVNASFTHTSHAGSERIRFQSVRAVIHSSYWITPSLLRSTASISCSTSAGVRLSFQLCVAAVSSSTESSPSPLVSISSNRALSSWTSDASRLAISFILSRAMRFRRL